MQTVPTHLTLPTVRSTPPHPPHPNAPPQSNAPLTFPFSSLAITQNLLRAGALIPLILAALTLGLNFGNAMQKPSKSASTTPNLSAFLSQFTPILLILYFAGAGMFTYAKYTWSAKWILLLSTVLNGGFAIVGGLGLLFAGESKSGQGSGWLL